MRPISLVLTILLLAGCSGGDDDRAAPADDGQDPAGSTTTTRAQATRPPIDVITGLVCDDAAKRLSGDPEAPNGSWECTKGTGPVRIDFYVDEAEQQNAPAPVICGPRFGIAVESTATRDALITELNAAEIPVSTCP